MSIQVRILEQILAWVKSCPCEFTLSSMSGGCVHVKFTVPSSRSLLIDQRMRGVCYNTLGENKGQELKPKVPQQTIDELMNKCYEDGFQDGRIAEHDRKENSK